MRTQDAHTPEERPSSRKHLVHIRTAIRHCPVWCMLLLHRLRWLPVQLVSHARSCSAVSEIVVNFIDLGYTDMRVPGRSEDPIEMLLLLEQHRRPLAITTTSTVASCGGAAAIIAD